MADLDSLERALDDAKAEQRAMWNRYIGDGSLWRRDMLATLTVEQCDAVAATICPYCKVRLPEGYEGAAGYPSMIIRHHIPGAEKFLCRAMDFRDAAASARVWLENQAAKEAEKNDA